MLMQERILDQISPKHYMIDDESLNLVIPGDTVTSQEGFMRYTHHHPVATAPIVRMVESLLQSWAVCRSPTNSSW